MTAEALWFIVALLLGVVIRIAFPYLQKKSKDLSTKFDYRTIYIGIIAIISALIEIAAIVVYYPDTANIINSSAGIPFGLFFGLGNQEIWSRILFHK